jgi:uncharacterized protein (DUF2267 family)
MSMTSLEIFNTTLQKTNEWLDEITYELALDDRHTAYVALRGTLHALRDRLPVEEAAHFGAQLPMLVRGFYYEGWRPAREPIKMHREDFLLRVEEQLTGGTAQQLDSEAVVRAVFQVLSRRISKGEIGQVEQTLPKDLRDLWPISVRVWGLFRPRKKSVPDELDQVDNSAGLELETIFHAEASSMAEVEALEIKSLLESNGIAAVLVGDSVLPNLPFEIKVARKEADRARQLIAEARSAGRASAKGAELKIWERPETWAHQAVASARLSIYRVLMLLVLRVFQEVW